MKKILFFLRVQVQAKCRRASPTRPGTGPAAEPNQWGRAPDYHLPAQLSPGKEMEPAPGGGGWEGRLTAHRPWQDVWG